MASEGGSRTLLTFSRLIHYRFHVAFPNATQRDGMGRHPSIMETSLSFCVRPRSKQGWACPQIIINIHTKHLETVYIVAHCTTFAFLRCTARSSRPLHPPIFRELLPNLRMFRTGKALVLYLLISYIVLLILKCTHNKP